MSWETYSHNFVSFVSNDFNLFDIGWLDASIKGYYWALLVSASSMEKLQPGCGVHIFEKGIIFKICYFWIYYFVFLPPKY